MAETETETVLCPDCRTERNPNTVCPKCGAPPLDEHRKNAAAGVREEDLEPYVALRYIARLFKILAALMILMLLAEVVVGFTREGLQAFRTLLSEVTQLLVMAGLMWGVGDLAILLIDAGHDLRVARILLGRINAELHKKSGEEGRDQLS